MNCSYRQSCMFVYRPMRNEPAAQCTNAHIAAIQRLKVFCSADNRHQCGCRVVIYREAPRFTQCFYFSPFQFWPRQPFFLDFIMTRHYACPFACCKYLSTLSCCCVHMCFCTIITLASDLDFIIDDIDVICLSTSIVHWIYTLIAIMFWITGWRILICSFQLFVGARGLALIVFSL